jgi:integral membrane protein
MATMSSTFDRHRTAGWFRIVAFTEAVTWVGLLTGMYFKYLGTPRTEIGVKIFGMAHGLVFIAFVVVAVLVGRAFTWSAVTWLLALLGSIVPLGSVIFLAWAERTGRTSPRGGQERIDRGHGAGAAVAAPPAVETT